VGDWVVVRFAGGAADAGHDRVEHSIQRLIVIAAPPQHTCTPNDVERF
jgi:hypothetical protein